MPGLAFFVYPRQKLKISVLPLLKYGMASQQVTPKNKGKIAWSDSKLNSNRIRILDLSTGKISKHKFKGECYVFNQRDNEGTTEFVLVSGRKVKKWIPGEKVGPAISCSKLIRKEFERLKPKFGRHVHLDDTFIEKMVFIPQSDAVVCAVQFIGLIVVDFETRTARAVDLGSPINVLEMGFLPDEKGELTRSLQVCNILSYDPESKAEMRVINFDNTSFGNPTVTEYKEYIRRVGVKYKDMHLIKSIESEMGKFSLLSTHTGTGRTAVTFPTVSIITDDEGGFTLSESKGYMNKFKFCEDGDLIFSYDEDLVIWETTNGKIVLRHHLDDEPCNIMWLD